jgi:DNA ligase-1
MRLESVAETSKRIAETPRRLEKIDLLATLLKQLHGEEIEIVVSFLSGRIRQGRIGIGYRTLQSALSPPAHHSSLEVIDADRTFQAIAATEGPGAEGTRVQLLQGLLSRATSAEQNFIQTLLAGELRQGALEGLMLEAVAKASGVSLERVRHAAMVGGDITTVAGSLLELGAAALEQFDVRLFRPVQPMLAQTAEDIGDALAELGEASREFKLDGGRVQVHRSGDQVAVFSRRMNDVTSAVPEIVEAVRAFPAKEFILDGEALSLRPDQRPQPFQVTMRRFGRKLDVDRMRAELPLSPFWFDILYLNGGPLLREPQARRFAALSELVPPESVVPHRNASDANAAREFFEESLSRGHEGVMVKALDAPYVAGARGETWLKVKHVRTLDLVVLAAEWGNGRRRGWLSNLHLGARDVEKGGFAMLGKTFKGLTDETLAWQTQEFLKLEISRDSYTVYVQPKLVVEIAFNDIQVSPRYPSGLALRFARVKRYRPDKSANDSDTFQTVQKLAYLASHPPSTATIEPET